MRIILKSIKYLTMKLFKKKAKKDSVKRGEN